MAGRVTQNEIQQRPLEVFLEHHRYKLVVNGLIMGPSYKRRASTHGRPCLNSTLLVLLTTFDILAVYLHQYSGTSADASNTRRRDFVLYGHHLTGGNSFCSVKSECPELPP